MDSRGGVVARLRHGRVAAGFGSFDANRVSFLCQNDGCCPDWTTAIVAPVRVDISIAGGAGPRKALAAELAHGIIERR